MPTKQLIVESDFDAHFNVEMKSIKKTNTTLKGGKKG